MPPRAAVRWLIPAALAVLAGLCLFDGQRQSWLLLANTAGLSLGSCLLSLPLGTLLAIVLTRTDLPARRGLLILMIALLFVPLYLVVAAWDAGFGQLGWHSLLWGRTADPWLSGWRAAIWIHALAAVPWVTLLLAAAARHLERSLEEEALLSGTARQVLWHVTLPRLRPALAIAAMWVLLATAGEMTVTDIYRVRTYAEVLYTGFALGDDLPQSAMRVGPGMGVVGLLVCGGYALAAGVAPAGRTALKPAQVFALGRWRWPALALVLAALLVIVAVPLGSLLYKAGVTVGQVGDVRVRQWSLAALGANVVGVPWRYADEFRWTFVLAAATATSALALGLPLAWVARRGGWRAVPAVAVAAAGLAAPGPLVGLSLIWLLDRPFPPGFIWLYDQTLCAPILALLVRTLSLTVLLGWYVLRTVGDDVLDAAACDGAGPWGRFWWVAVPPRVTALAAVWLFAFAVAAGDLACSILVVPAGVTTVPIRVFGLLHAGVDDQVAGICLVTLGGFVLLSAVVCHLMARWTAART